MGLFHRNKIYFLLFFCFLIFSCGGNDLSRLKAISAKLAALPSEKSYDVRLVYSDSNKVKVVLTSPYLVSYKTDRPYQEMPKGIHIDFLNPAQKVVSTVDALYGIRYEIEKKVVVRKNVVVITKEGTRLNTEELTWDQNKKKVFTDKYVKVTKPDGQYEGDGLDANEDFTEYSFRNFKGKVQMKNDSLFH